MTEKEPDTYLLGAWANDPSFWPFVEIVSALSSLGAVAQARVVDAFGATIVGERIRCAHRYTFDLDEDGETIHIPAKEGSAVIVAGIIENTSEIDVTYGFIELDEPFVKSVEVIFDASQVLRTLGLLQPFVMADSLGIETLVQEVQDEKDTQV